MPNSLKTSGRRLAIEARITGRDDAALALNHIAEACRMDPDKQGEALQDYAVPALRWALLRIAVLETELMRGKGERRHTPRFGAESRPAPL